MALIQRSEYLPVWKWISSVLVTCRSSSMLWKLMEVPDIWRHPAVLLFPALHVLLLRFSNTTRLIFILNMVLFLQRFKKLFRAHVWVFSHSYFLSFSASMFYSSCLTGCRVFTVALTKWWNLNLKRKWKLLMSVYYTVQLCKGDILFSGPFWIGTWGKKGVPWCWNPMFVSLCLPQ